MIIVLVTVGLPAIASAQDGGDGGGDGGTGLNYPDSTSSGLPRENVTGPSAAGRSPGTWTLTAIGRFANLHGRSIDQFGGAEYSAQPDVPRRRTFLLTFLPEAFAIINELILAYIVAIQTGQTPTTQPG
jgi:hypothetical protein